MPRPDPEAVGRTLHQCHDLLRSFSRTAARTRDPHGKPRAAGNPGTPRTVSARHAAVAARPPLFIAGGSEKLPHATASRRRPSRQPAEHHARTAVDGLGRHLSRPGRMGPRLHHLERADPRRGSRDRGRDSRSLSESRRSDRSRRAPPQPDRPRGGDERVVSDPLSESIARAAR